VFLCKEKAPCVDGLFIPDFIYFIFLEYNFVSQNDVLKLRIYEMGLNQKKLSELLGVSPSRISDYLSGRCEPTLNIARKMSQQLNIDANIILGV
jgi:plasmid maintenance system antidote protein VapI